MIVGGQVNLVGDREMCGCDALVCYYFASLPWLGLGVDYLPQWVRNHTQDWYPFQICVRAIGVDCAKPGFLDKKNVSFFV